MSAPTISGEPQPTELPRTSPHTIPNRPPLASTRPGRSTRPNGPFVSARRGTSASSAMPTGTLSQKTQCHEKPLTTAPPTSGPNATARPLMPPHAPRNTPRRSSGTPAERIVSVSGITIAPPRPWTARAASSAPIVGASAAAADAAVKIVDPDREQPPAAEAVPEGRTGEEQHGERQRVGVDRPLEAADPGVQVLADHRQRRRHDEVVERDHEEGERGDRERPPHVCAELAL